MKIPKERTTVTPLSKGLAMFLFITLPIIAFFLGFNYQNNVSVISNNQTAKYQNIRTGTMDEILAKDEQERESKLIRAYNKIFFIDKQYGYTLDLSNLPEASTTDPDGEWVNNFDMYTRVGWNMSSVARFGLSKVYDDPDNLGLKIFAEQKLRYKEGKEDGYGGIETTNPILPADIDSDYSVMTYTTESNFILTKNYLMENNGKVVLLGMYAWNEGNYLKALPDFKEVASSFRFEE